MNEWYMQKSAWRENFSLKKEGTYFKESLFKSFHGRVVYRLFGQANSLRLVKTRYDTGMNNASESKTFGF
jgi:hypothetical protein